MKAVFAATILASLVGTPVLAADRPYDWSGLYVGGQGGFAFGRSEQYDGLALGSTGHYSMDGAMGGGTLGFNWQSGVWMFGVETDFSVADIKGTSNGTQSWDCIVANGCVTKVDWFGTVRGRVGYASDRWMLYGTGGYAYGRNHIEIVGNSTFSSAPTESGWTAGGGLEYAFAPNWTAKLDYLHVDLGDRIRWTTFTPGGIPDPGYVKVSFDAVRVGLNYKFGSAR